MLMRKVSGLSLFVLIASIFALPQANAAPPKIGSSCTKVGAYFNTPNTRYVCEQEGTKKVWRVWSPGPGAAPKKPVEKTSQRKLLKPAPVTGNYGITWANITNKVNDISAAAWTDAQNTMVRNQNNPDVYKGFASYLSPGALKADPLIGKATVLIKRTMALYANVIRAKNVYFVATTLEEQVATLAEIKKSHPDALWALTRSLNSISGIDVGDGVVAGSVFIQTRCDRSDFERNAFSQPTRSIPSISTAVVTVSVCPLNENDERQAVHIAAHEYVHTIQVALHPGGYIREYQPCWMTEGEPEWSQAVVADDFSTYLSLQHFGPYKIGPGGLNPTGTTQLVWTPKDIETYLKKSADVKTCNEQDDWAYSYSLGAATVEALVALGGSESVFALDERVSAGQTINKAFSDVYGITWDAAVPILSQVVAEKITKSFPSERLTYQTKP